MITNETLNEMLNNPILAPIWAILGVVFNKILEAIIPDMKNISSYIKKYLLWAYLYVFPISMVILLMIFADFNKFFILNMIVYGTSVMFNYLLDLNTSNFRMIGQMASELKAYKDSQTEIVEGLQIHDKVLFLHGEQLNSLHLNKKNKKKSPKTQTTA
jgi:hypothetical protein